MPLPAETKVQGRRAAASCGCSHDGKLDCELAPRGLENDRRLVEALRRDEPTAAEDLVASYGGQAHRLAFGITGNQSDAEEVVQDALWKVVRKIDAFRGNSAFGSWLYRIVANVAYDKLRHRRGRFGDCSLDEVSATVDEHGESFMDWSSRTRDPSPGTELRIALIAALGGDPYDVAPRPLVTTPAAHLPGNASVMGRAVLDLRSRDWKYVSNHLRSTSRARCARIFTLATLSLVNCAISCVDSPCTSRSTATVR